MVAVLPRTQTVASLSAKVQLGTDATSYVVETTMLPLRVTADPLYARSTIAIGAGALAVVKGKAVILDRVGRIFLYDRGSLAEDTCPRLPMNGAAFEKAGLFPLDESTLRAHDLQYDAATGSLFASFETYDDERKATHFEIARASIDGGGHCTGPWEKVVMGPPLVSTAYYSGRGAGGKMALDGDRLYFAVGDYNLDRPSYPAAQLPNSFYGKTYRYDLGAAQLNVLSSGHRVPLGLMLDSNQRLWLTENGPRGGDKLDLIKPGQNYGWPFASLGTRYFHYTSAAITTATEDDFTKPAYAWMPSIAPSQIIEATDFDAHWNGDLLVGSLKAQTLYRLHLNGDGVVYAEPVWLGHRIRDVAIASGQIVVLTDDGTLMTIAPEYAAVRHDTINVETAYRQRDLSSCSSCHSFSKDSPLPWAPSLAGVYGRPIGGSQFGHYSTAMRRKGGVWDEASLAAFLSDPAAFVPGTSMPAVHLTPDLVGKVIADLRDIAFPLTASTGRP